MARHDERPALPAGGKGRMVETSSLESGERLVHEAVERGCITGSVHSIEQLEFEIEYVEKNKKYTTREVAKKAYEKAPAGVKFQKGVRQGRKACRRGKQPLGTVG